MSTIASPTLSDAGPLRGWRGLRAGLADAVFPADPQRWSRHGGLVAAILVAVGFTAALVASYLRLSVRGAGSVWAEDGTRFLTQVFDLGFVASVLEPYNGYAHLMPRLAAGASTLFPLEVAETVLAVSASGFVALAATATYLLSRGHLPSVTVRLVLAAMVVVLPVAGFEAAGNVANSHWFMMAAALWALIGRPSGAGRVGLATVVVILAMGSDPLTLILAPLVLGRLLLLGRRRDHVVTVAFVVAAALQLSLVLETERSEGPPTTLGAALASYAVRIPFGLLTGVEWSPALFTEHGWSAVTASVLVFAVAGLVTAWGPPRLRWLALISAVASTAFFVAPVTITWAPHFDPEGVNGLRPISGGRYSIVPMLLLLVVLGAALQTVRQRSRVIFAAATGVLVVVLGITVVPDYRPVDDFRGGPSWNTGVASAQQACRTDPALATAMIPLSPEDPRWMATIPCDRLR